MHVLLEDDLGRLRMQRLRSWHRLLARGQAARLDRELAGGASPEASASLAARAAELTSTEFRRDLAANVRWMLFMAGEPASTAPLRAARPVRVPLRTARISRSAPVLAEMASRLLEPGPVPARGVAMVTQLLADGTGPLYRAGTRDELTTVAERAVQALTW